MPISRLSLASRLSSLHEKYLLLPFYMDGRPLPSDGGSPCWGMSLRAAGSMRFRWQEKNVRREAFLADLCSREQRKGRPLAAGECGLPSAGLREPFSAGDSKQAMETAFPASATFCRTPAFVELIHSKIVYDVSDREAASRLQGKTGDGIITADRALVPVVTVADCMPLFLYDGGAASRDAPAVFGAFHSGWKGTGIIGEGIALAESRYGARREELCVAIGPHIQSCCYVVDEERAAYFANNFTPDAVRPLHEFNAAGKRLYSLSLLEANLAVLRREGIRESNIVAATDCTCCSCLPGPESGGQPGQGSAGQPAYFPFGSFRRQAAFMLPELDADRRSRLMTVQAAFCMWR